MTVHSFVYSNNPRYRLFRHCAFWFVWISYYVITMSLRPASSDIGYWPFLQYTLFENLVLLSVDILFCYSVLYFLLPRYLLHEKYGTFFLFIALFGLLDAALSSYFYTWVINPLRGLFGLKPFSYIGVVDLLRSMHGVVMMTALGVSIKFYKMWNIKKKELYLAQSEKVNKELKFIDTYIQPSFLPVMLKKIYSFSFSTANRVPEMLDKLKNIVNYLIEECNQPTVLLSHEIDAIKDFIQLEKLTNASDITIEYEQSGEPENLRIVPYILFPLVENNFRQVNDRITDKHWTNVSVQIDGSRVTLQLRNSKPVETSNLMNYETANLQQMRKRLDLLYTGSYRMNILIEENIFSIRLEIDLSKAVN
ncbi:MAG TPA: histidine kinase [Sediminibacterium sp.]